MLKRWAIFISGTGSNMMTLLENKNINIVCIVTSDPQAVGAKRAKRRGVAVINFSKNDSWEDLNSQLHDLGIENIFLAGFMRILPQKFVQEWKERIFNIHPSLLPKYPGLHSIERAHQERQSAGVTIHLVDEGIDTGNVLMQKEVLLHSSLEIFEFLVHVNEHNMIRKFIG
jgi:phosphoribosylglycinamide formyltransferase-1